MHALVMLTMLDRHLLLSITALRCLQKIWLDLEVDELLHFLITFLNSSFEKLGYSDKGFKGISSKMCKFTWWFCAELNVWCSTCHRSSSVMILNPLEWDRRTTLVLSNTRELDRVPSTKYSTLYTNPRGPC